MRRGVCPSCGNSSGVVPCPNCGRAPRAGNVPWSQWRVRADQDAFRRRAVARADGRCMWVDPATGVRCPRMVGVYPEMDAHHGPGGEPVLLCNPHHRAVDPHARPRGAS